MALSKSVLALMGLSSLATLPVAQAGELLNGSFTTPSGAAAQADLCMAGAVYPREHGYGSGGIASTSAASSGQPKIEQYRQGSLIATYTSLANRPTCNEAGDGTDYLHPAAPAASGCGPFNRGYGFRLWAPGDVFKVYPAVYTGDYNQPYIGPAFDSPDDETNNISHTPDNVLIEGVVVNNVRPVILLRGAASNNTLGQAPVYFGGGTGVTMDNIDVITQPGSTAGKAGIYINGNNNLTLSNMRVSGFMFPGVNGLFSTTNTSGTLTLTGLELDHNGGTNGPAHNAYIDGSTTDPNFKVVLTNSWSHHAFYGHLFKSRAQAGVFTGNLFQGGLPIGARKQAEAYGLDIPNGGQVSVRNNIFIKNMSGPNSNGISFTYLLEGYADARPQSLDVENNTFITYSRTYDGSSLNLPMSFFYPAIRPDSTFWPSSIPARVIKNAFVGYCSLGNGSIYDYRGDIDVIDGFSDMTSTFAFRTKIQAPDATLAAIYGNYTPEVGTWSHSVLPVMPNVRTTATIGAQD